MTRFLFITDTHIGANPIGFHQQPAYPNRLEELLAEIEHITRSADIDFVLHGGDMIDHCSVETIHKAKQLFRLSVPVYLSLGNHDLNCVNALPLWLELAPEFFKGGTPHYTIDCGSCVIHVLPNQWERGVPYFWNKAQEPLFLDEQLQQLAADILKSPEKIHILSIHNPIFGVPADQTGMDHLIHDVPEQFRNTIVDLMRSFPNVRCVLSGHNHINTLTKTEEGVFVSGSSFIETPFEYKVVEVTETYLQITTLARSGTLSFEPEYDAGRAFVQGRERDRNIVWRFGVNEHGSA